MARSRFVYRPGHAKANERGFVNVEDLNEVSSLAKDAPFMVGRFYENLGAFTDGTPVNSRRDHAEYLKRTNTTVMDDYKVTWANAEAQREKSRQGGTNEERRARRDDVARALYNRRKP